MRVIVILTAILCAIPAHAGTVRQDCKADAMSYCFSVVMSVDPETKAGRSAIIACMLKNRSRLSAACARHLHD